MNVDKICKSTIEARQNIIDRVNHDLYLEGVHKSQFQHEQDKRWINGEITLEEQKQIELNYILSGGDLN